MGQRGAERPSGQGWVMVEITESELKEAIGESVRLDNEWRAKKTAFSLKEQKFVTLHMINDGTRPRKYTANYPGNPIGVRLTRVLLGEIDRIAEETEMNRAETIRKGVEVFVKYCNEHPGFVNMIKKDPRAGGIK